MVDRGDAEYVSWGDEYEEVMRWQMRALNLPLVPC